MISEHYRWDGCRQDTNFREHRRTRVAHDPPHDREQQRLWREEVPRLRGGRVPDLREQARVHQHQHWDPPRASRRRGKIPLPIVRNRSMTLGAVRRPDRRPRVRSPPLPGDREREVPVVGLRQGGHVQG